MDLHGLFFSDLPEQVTTKKRETLILNVDGCIAACFVDLLRSCGAFTQEEVSEVKMSLIKTALELPDDRPKTNRNAKHLLSVASFLMSIGLFSLFLRRMS